jgi:ATP-dependent DNA helicase RecG
LLFFNENPDKFFPCTQIDVVWFPEGAGGDRFDEKIFKWPLARMTREALSYIQRNFLHETVIKHPDRAEATRVWNFPYAAIEEAVVNAVYHRSYEERECEGGRAPEAGRQCQFGAQTRVGWAV